MLGFSAENHFDFKFSKGPTLRISYRIFVLIERPVLLGILISLVIVLVLTPSDCLAIWFAVVSVFVSDERLILVVISFFLLAETLALGSASRCWFSVPFLKDATTSILATNIKGSLSSPSCVVRAATTSTASSKAASKAASAAPAASTSSKSFILLYEIIQTLMLNCVHSYGFCALK
jgi:hypothetical protein